MVSGFEAHGFVSAGSGFGFNRCEFGVNGSAGSGFGFNGFRIWD
jgi:hypothetical protein